MHSHNAAYRTFACAGNRRPVGESSPRALAAVLDLPTFILAWDKHSGIWDNTNEAHMALIWLKSCPCLCDDNHGVVANIQLRGSGKVWGNVETQCMAGPQLDPWLQMETTDKRKYRALCLHIKDARLLPRTMTLWASRQKQSKKGLWEGSQPICKRFTSCGRSGMVRQSWLSIKLAGTKLAHQHFLSTINLLRWLKCKFISTRHHVVGVFLFQQSLDLIFSQTIDIASESCNRTRKWISALMVKIQEKRSHYSMGEQTGKY